MSPTGLVRSSWIASCVLRGCRSRPRRRPCSNVLRGGLRAGGLRERTASQSVHTKTKSPNAAAATRKTFSSPPAIGIDPAHLSLPRHGVSGTPLEAAFRRALLDASVTNVVLPFDGDFARLRALLARWGWEVGERPNAPVFAEGPSVTLHAYNTGKLMLSGRRAREYAEALDAELGRPGPGPGPGPGAGAPQGAPAPFTMLKSRPRVGSGWMHSHGALAFERSLRARSLRRVRS